MVPFLLQSEQLHLINFLNRSGTLTSISTPPQWQDNFFIDTFYLSLFLFHSNSYPHRTRTALNVHVLIHFWFTYRLKIQPDWLYGKFVIEQNKNMKLTVPFYLHKVGAGFPSPATDYIEEDVDLNIHLIKNVPATFIIRVQGKSMTDVGIYDGDLLVVDKSLKPKNFSTVVANVHDELVVKNFVKEKDEQFLTSGSKKIEDKITINNDSEIFIWGVVTYVIHSVY